MKNGLMYNLLKVLHHISYVFWLVGDKLHTRGVWYGVFDLDDAHEKGRNDKLNGAYFIKLSAVPFVLLHAYLGGFLFLYDI